MRSPTLVCQELSYVYPAGPTIAVKSLVLSTGVTAVQGPNGSGKSTLLWLLAGLFQPTSGTIVLKGSPVQSLTSLRKCATLLMEQPYLLKTTVRGNVDYGLGRHGVAPRERQERVAMALDQVGLDGFAHRKAWHLSQGERKRVALARALAIRPEILLLDEPTAQVDLQSEVRIKAVIEQIRDTTTIVMATHDIKQAQQVADTVVTMLGGTLSDVSHENLLTGVTVEDNDGSIAILSDGVSVRLADKCTGPLRLLIDPAAIRVSPSTNGQAPMQIVELTRERETIRVVLAGELSLVARIRESDFDSRALVLGQRVNLEIRPDGVRVLDKGGPC